MSDYTQPLRKRITQLETEVWALRKQAQRQRIAQKYGREFLTVLDSKVNSKVFVTDIVQKLVFQDEEGNIVSETDASLVGKIINVRFNSLLHWENKWKRAFWIKPHSLQSNNLGMGNLWA